jgi:hypothetical protein
MALHLTILGAAVLNNFEWRVAEPNTLDFEWRSASALR